jgi:hypothetical protein
MTKDPVAAGGVAPRQCARQSCVVRLNRPPRGFNRFTEAIRDINARVLM